MPLSISRTGKTAKEREVRNEDRDLLQTDRKGYSFLLSGNGLGRILPFQSGIQKGCG